MEEYFEDLEDCTDLQLGKYDIEVMNGDGYYDEFGNFVRFRSDDDWWYS